MSPIALATASPLIGRRLVLRVCSEAETTASRWYAQFHEYLAAVGEPELVTEIIEGRRERLGHTREMIRRIEAALKQTGLKSLVIAGGVSALFEGEPQRSRAARCRSSRR